MALTQNEYTGDGVTTLFSFTFPYIDERDVRVRYDNVLQDRAIYSFANATTLSFLTPPADGVRIVILRDTNVTTIEHTFFPGSAIRSRDLNDNFTQGLYVLQESDTNTTLTEEMSREALIKAEAAVVTANEAKSTADATESTADTAESTANTALSTANTAKSTADTAKSTADAAAVTASSADSKADTAISDSAQATIKSDIAIADSAEALSTANEALTVAAGLDGSFVKTDGDNMTGDLTLGTNKIELDASDGSITTKGALSIVCSPIPLLIKRSAAASGGTLLSRFSNNAGKAIDLYTDGSALFEGSITAAGYALAALPTLPKP